MLDPLLHGLGAVMLLVACVLATIGLYGMLRRPDIFEQLHAAGLVTGPATILVLLASVATGDARIITSALLVMVFVLITSSLSTHVIAQAAFIRRGPTDDLDQRTHPARGDDPDDEDTEMRPRAMRVLLAYDGSPGARVAADLAAALPWPSGTLLRVAGVEVGGLPPDWADDAPPPADEGAADLVAALRSLASELEPADGRGESVLLEGDPTMAIVEEANALGADLVVVGTRSLGTRSLLESSVAGEIVDRAPCPVLVARRPAVREILLSTDGSDASAAAVDLVASWPIFREAHIRVVSVASEAGDEARGSAGGVSAAETAARHLRDHGRDAIVELAVGTPASGITEAASRTGTDLIIIGSRGRTGLRRTVLGSVTREVLESAQCSVLVINS
jgi:monovalent cation/proton antiporter MnhG/PhaG subunit